MGAVKKVVIILLVLFTFVLVLEAASFLPLLFFGFGGSSNNEKILDKIASQSENSANNTSAGNALPNQASNPVNSQSENAAELNIVYDPAPQEVIDQKIDCSKASEIPAQFRKGKIYCQNIYQTDGEKIVGEVNASGADRIILYGQHIIQNCPAKTDTKIANLAEGCYATARFLDNYLYRKTANILGAPISKNKLYVHLEDSEKKTTKICNVSASAVGCSDKGKSIFLSLLSDKSDFYFLGGPEPGILRGYKAWWNKNVTYFYKEVFPKNCPMPPVLLHELTHYFDYLSYGTMNTHMEEAVARIYELHVWQEVCPPGITTINATREEDGKSVPVDNVDMTSQESVLSFLEDYWKGDSCWKAYFTVINQGVIDYGVAFHADMSKAFNSSQNWKNISQVMISVSHDPDKARATLKAGGCPM